jgi:hypothetical protein
MSFWGSGHGWVDGLGLNTLWAVLLFLIPLLDVIELRLVAAFF